MTGRLLLSLSGPTHTSIKSLGKLVAQVTAGFDSLEPLTRGPTYIPFTFLIYFNACSVHTSLPLPSSIMKSYVSFKSSTSLPDLCNLITV